MIGDRPFHCAIDLSLEKICRISPQADSQTPFLTFMHVLCGVQATDGLVLCTLVVVGGDSL